jgi:hypothetical protein
MPLAAVLAQDQHGAGQALLLGEYLNVPTRLVIPPSGRMKRNHLRPAVEPNDPVGQKTA